LRSPERPDLILLDLSTPSQGAVEFQKVLQRDPTLSSIPVIILTAKDCGERASADYIGYLEMPLDTRCLLEKINAIFMHQASPDQGMRAPLVHSRSTVGS